MTARDALTLSPIFLFPENGVLERLPLLEPMTPSEKADLNGKIIIYLKGFPDSGDLETASRCFSVLAALFYGRLDDFRKERFHYEASFRMVSRGRRQRATVPTNKMFALAFLAHCVTT